jgi:phosphoglycolate phosphatase
VSRFLPALIFDLDGTLTDSKPGIVACLRKALDQRGMGDCGPLDRFVGPPVEEWVVELLPHGTAEERAALVRDYRDRYGREGWSNNSVFPGVRDMLVALRQHGFPLYVCTSKYEPSAVRTLEAFQLAPFFTAIYGDKPECPSHNKVDLLAHVLRERSLALDLARDAARDSAWMIGDRVYDFEAARANGVPSMAAAWGYGAPQEWAQADAVAATPDALLDLMIPHPAANERPARPHIALA